jgi:CelD/BcsL family acetyltransferase involved in cellulose biosynthesis
MLTIRFVNNRSELSRIASDWDKLYSRQSELWPSLHWIWFDTFWSEMDLSGWQVFILTAWKKDELVGAAPLMSRATRIAGLRCRELAGLENVHHTDIYNWLLPPEPDQTEEVAGALVKELSRCFSERLMFALKSMSTPYSVTQTIVRVLEKAGFHIIILPRDYSLTFSLRNEPQLVHRRSWKNLNKLGRVRFEEVSTSSRLLEYLSACWTLEASTWKGELGTAVAQSQHIVNFYNKLALKMADVGKFGLWLLFCNDTLVAFDYCLIDNGVIYGMKSSFNPAYARISPGHLILWKIMKWAEKQGIKEYNLGGEVERWKLEWTKIGQERVDLFAFPKGAMGWLMYLTNFGWKDIVKKIPYAIMIKKWWDKRLKNSAKWVTRPHFEDHLER